MSEPTPEERTKATFLSMLDYSICEKHGKANEDGCFICEEIRAAVAAEREACAEVDSTIIACPTCKCVPGKFCLTTQGGTMLLCHHERWRAAIRALGKPPSVKEDSDVS